MDSTTKAQPTDGERVLIEQFRGYLDEIFWHDNAAGDQTLIDRVTLVAFDLVEAAGILAENELGREPASYLCRRACDLRKLSIEITAFLDAESAEERSKLPTVKGAQYRKELQAQYGSGHQIATTEVAP